MRCWTLRPASGPSPLTVAARPGGPSAGGGLPEQPSAVPGVMAVAITPGHHQSARHRRADCQRRDPRKEHRSVMSDHLSGTRALADPAIDLTDLYAFPGSSGADQLVLAMNVFPYARPPALFSDAASYRFRVRPATIPAGHPEAYADHAAEFWLSVGGDPRRALRLARQNLTFRPTPRAHALANRAMRQSLVAPIEPALGTTAVDA